MYALATVSGKGGTGKSVVAASLAQRLLERGFKVGLIDADFSNPNLSRLIRMPTTITITQDKKLVPSKRDDLSFFSIESIAEGKGIAMRGEQYSQIIIDVVLDGIWDCDYMIVDLPAVIGDEFKTVLQVFEDNYIGSIVLAQPSHLTTTDRVLDIHRVNGIPVLGVIENFVEFVCEHGTSYKVFGESGIDELAQRYNIPVLGKIPLTMDIQKQLNSGVPVRLPFPEVIEKTVNVILEAKPKKLGFMQELRKGIKRLSSEVILSLLVESIKLINMEVPLAEYQQKHSYPGGNIIQLVILDDAGQKQLQEVKVKLQDGKFVGVGRDVPVDFQIFIKLQSLGWVITGVKIFPDGTEIPYTLRDALLTGDAQVMGAGSFTNSVAFWNDVWDDAIKRIRPKLTPYVKRLM